ncbi:MAG: tRNA pseudouridine(38-40) synthase TruA [Vicinamibacterales bacterium]
MHLKLTIAYDGTGLVGWQRQPTGTSVQALLEEALAPIAGGPVAVAGAGRTDAGVHALAQVASVALARVVTMRAVVQSANMYLPPAVRVLAAEEVDPAFHARFDAVAKRYRYRLWNSRVLDPFERSYAWHLPGPPLDVAAMNAAAARLIGTHDFAAFKGAGTDVETSVRSIFASAVNESGEPDHGRLLTYEVRGNGFLRHMVRSIAGTLVEVGRGRRPVSSIDELLTLRDRASVGRTAPAYGLFLVAVEYK